MTLMRTAGHWGVAQTAPEAHARRALVNLSHDPHRRTLTRVRERFLPDSDALRLEPRRWCGRGGPGG